MEARVAGNAAHLLELPTGAGVYLQPLGYEEHLVCRFLGAYRRDYLVFAMPRSILSGSAFIFNFLFNANPLKVSYHRDGALYGVNSEIASTSFFPFPHLFAAWPNASERLPLRAHARVDCHLPASLSLQDGRERHGLLLNVSMGGCRFALLDGGNGSGPGALPGVDEPVQIRFAMAGMATPVMAAGRVLALEHSRGRILVAVVFEEIEDDGAHALEAFIKDVLAYRGY